MKRLIDRIEQLVAIAKCLLAIARRNVAVGVVFLVAFALPPAAVWFATRGHGAAKAVISDPLRVDQGPDVLHTWRWADYDKRIVRLPIDLAITRYLQQHH